MLFQRRDAENAERSAEKQKQARQPDLCLSCFQFSLRLSLRSLISIENFLSSGFTDLERALRLFLLRLLRRRFFHFGSGFLQVLDNLTVQFIDAGFAVTLRKILRP